MHPLATPVAKVASIERRYLAGEPIASIAANENVGRSTVVKYVRHLPRRQSGRLTPQTISEIESLSDQGHKQLTIARKLGVSLSSVKRYEPSSNAARRRRGRARKTAGNTAR